MPKQTTGISFDVKTLKALRMRAKSERRSISMLVNWAVEEWLASPIRISRGSEGKPVEVSLDRFVHWPSTKHPKPRKESKK
jgi:hypothetical protein